MELLPDKELFWEVLKWLGSACVGALVQDHFRRAPRVVSYILHPTTVRVSGREIQSDIYLNSHALCIENLGGAPASNLRILHTELPDCGIWPKVPVEVEQRENVAPTLIFKVVPPGERLTIQYLYTPPLLASQVHIKESYDEGQVKRIEVWHVQYYGRTFNFVVALLMFLGAAAAIYLSITFILYLCRLYAVLPKI